VRPAILRGTLGTLCALAGLVLLAVPGPSSSSADPALWLEPPWWGGLLLFAAGGLLGGAVGRYALRVFRKEPSPEPAPPPEQRKVEEAVQEATRRLQGVIRASPQAIIALSPDWSVKIWNPAAERLFGWTEQEVLGRPLPFVPSDQRAKVRGISEALSKGNALNGVQVRYHRRDGSPIDVSLMAAPLLDAMGGIDGLVAVVNDITERKRSKDDARTGVHFDTLRAIMAAAATVTDLQGLLGGALDRTLKALGLEMGSVAVEGCTFVKGLAKEIGLAMTRIPPPSKQGLPGATVVVDWQSASFLTPDGVDSIVRCGVRASISVPILSQGRRLGGLAVASALPRIWSAEDIALVESVGQQLSQAVERLQVSGDAQQHTRLMGLLVGVSKTLSRPATVPEVVKAIGEGALVLSGADRAALYLRQLDGTLTCPWSHALPTTYIAQVLHHGRELAGGRLIDGAQPDALELPARGGDGTVHILYPDIEALPSEVALPRLAQSAGYRALANWPLVHEGRGIGLVCCYYDAPRTWPAPEQEVFRAFCSEASEAIQNARLYDAHLQRTTDLEALFDLSRRLRAARNAEEICPILVRHAMDLLHADHGTLAVLDRSREALTWAYASWSPGDVPPEVMGSAFPVTGSSFGHVAQSGATFVTEDFAADPLPVWLSGYRAVGPAVIVPLRSEREIIGTLGLGRKRNSDRVPFTKAEVQLLEGLAEIGATAIRRARLFEGLEQAYVQMVLVLARAVDARDAYTAGHCERIAVWAESVAVGVGCGEEEAREIRWAGLLHDIGKIGVPDEILRKPGKLTDAEWKLMRQHAVIGEEILATTERMRGVAHLVRHHQERWDGSGYPDGIRGEAIPLGARILAVVDAYSAITDDRPYRKARTHAEALAELRRCAGSQFDPQVVDIFCEVVNRGKVEANIVR